MKFYKISKTYSLVGSQLHVERTMCNNLTWDVLF